MYVGKCLVVLGLRYHWIRFKFCCNLSFQNIFSWSSKQTILTCETDVKANIGRDIEHLHNIAFSLNCVQLESYLAETILTYSQSFIDPPSIAYFITPHLAILAQINFLERKMKCEGTYMQINFPVMLSLISSHHYVWRDCCFMFCYGRLWIGNALTSLCIKYS